MADKRKRAVNFCAEEKMRFLDILQKKGKIITSKVACNNQATNRLKEEAWTVIANDLNAYGNVYRTTTNIKKLWQKLKQDAKNKAFVCHRTNGGSDGPVKIEDPVLELVNEITRQAEMESVHESDFEVPYTDTDNTSSPKLEIITERPESPEIGFTPTSTPHSMHAMSSTPYNENTMSIVPQSMHTMSGIPDRVNTMSTVPFGVIAMSAIPYSGNTMSNVPHSMNALSSLQYSGNTMSSVPHSVNALSSLPYSGNKMSNVPDNVHTTTIVPHSMGTPVKTESHIEIVKQDPDDTDCVTPKIFNYSNFPEPKIRILEAPKPHNLEGPKTHNTEGPKTHNAEDSKTHNAEDSKTHNEEDSKRHIIKRHKPNANINRQTTAKSLHPPTNKTLMTERLKNEKEKRELIELQKKHMVEEYKQKMKQAALKTKILEVVLQKIREEKPVDPELLKIMGAM